MHKFKTSVLLGIVLTFLVGSVWGQAAKSPFSSRGIGDTYGMGLARNQALGGVGISNGDHWYLNNMNPALLPYNTLTVFSAGFVGEYRQVTNNTVTENNGSGNLNYLATAFPVKPGKWTTSIGLMPYSNVDFQFSQTAVIDGGGEDEEVLVTEEGFGGYNQVYWSNGVAISNKLYAGVKAAYLFSAVTTEFSNELITADNLVFSPTVSERISISDFMFSAGLAFRQDSIFNNKISFKAGLTYDFESDVNAEQLQSRELRAIGQPVLAPDTLSNASGSITIPQAFGIGLSFNNRQKWSVALDVKMQQWADYKNFQDNDEGLDNSLQIGLGAEFTPDNSSVNNYFKRITYRVGFSYEKTPYVISGKQVKDFGINFGWSLPVSRFSSLDMAFEYGKRGDVQETMISENYFKAYLGISLNDQWFIKRKYD